MAVVRRKIRSPPLCLMLMTTQTLMLTPMPGMAVDLVDTVMVVELEVMVNMEDVVDIVAREKPKLNPKLNLKPPL